MTEQENDLNEEMVNEEAEPAGEGQKKNVKKAKAGKKLKSGKEEIKETNQEKKPGIFSKISHLLLDEWQPEPTEEELQKEAQQKAAAKAEADAKKAEDKKASQKKAAAKKAPQKKAQTKKTQKKEEK